MVIDENGVVTIKTLEGTEIRMLQVNASGELIALEAGSPTEILNGEGEWVALPVSLGTLNGSGDAIFANKVGIGTSSPTKELEITGDALIQGLLQANLIQAGGIKLSSLTGSGNRVVIANSVGELEVLSAGNADEVLNGEGNWIELQENFWEADASGNLTHSSDSVTISGKLKTGELESRDILVKSGYLALMDSAEINAMGIKFYSFNDDTIPDMYVAGKLSSGNLDVPWTTLGPPIHLCLPGVFKNPTGAANPIAVSKGFSRLWSPSTSNGNVSLYLGSNGFNTIIDGSDNTPGDPTSTPLLINTYCGKDVEICTGSSGVVTVGKNFEVGLGVQRDLNRTVNIFSGVTAHASKTTHGSDYGYNSVIDVNRYKTKALTVQLGSVSPAEENFLVYGDGQALIGSERLSGTHAAAAALLQVAGTIAAKEIYVIEPGSWSDFVFDDDYKLKDLNEVESYYTKHKHLPDVPSESEVKTNGYDLSEMNAILLRKIEELTLYIVNQKKDIENIQRQLDQLNKN